MDDKAWQLLLDDIKEIKQDQKEIRSEIQKLNNFKTKLITGGGLLVSIVSGAVTFLIHFISNFKKH